jgi:hypothetical protein
MAQLQDDGNIPSLGEDIANALACIKSVGYEVE